MINSDQWSMVMYGVVRLINVVSMVFLLHWHADYPLNLIDDNSEKSENTINMSHMHITITMVWKNDQGKSSKQRKIIIMLWLNVRSQIKILRDSCDSMKCNCKFKRSIPWIVYFWINNCKQITSVRITKMMRPCTIFQYPINGLYNIIHTFSHFLFLIFVSFCSTEQYSTCTVYISLIVRFVR